MGLTGAWVRKMQVLIQALSPLKKTPSVNKIEKARKEKRMNE